MGLHTFKFKTDFMHNLEEPIIFIAKKNKTIITPIALYEGLNLEFNLNAYQTISFDVPMEVNGVIQECYSELEEGRLLLVQGICWYEIHVEESNDGSGWVKSVTGNSLEIMLSKKNLVDFECNSGEILYDDYVKTIFYDPGNPKGSLLDRALNVSSNWSVGHVDGSLANKQRSFDVDNQDVYSFLTGEVSEAFNCLFVFDTFNYLVNAYDLDSYGTDTNIFVSMDNLANNMDITIDENSIFTCYRVNGGDGVYINEVNPNGTNKIYNFDYYLPEMSEELRTKINSYNNVYQASMDKYEDIMLRMQTSVDIILELNNRFPDDLTSTDWTAYGLTMLQTKQKSFENLDVIYKGQGMNVSSSSSYNSYLENAKKLENVLDEIKVREKEIANETEKYNAIKIERNNLQYDLDMDTWFTEEDWKELDCYVTEETYDNDNYIVTDLEDDSERLDIEKQLYDVAMKDLNKKCRPQYQYSSDLYNVLTIPEFKDFLQYFELGNFIRMETNYNQLIKLRLIGFSVDYNNTETIAVTFSDGIRAKGIYEDASSIQAQVSSAALSFQFNKTQYDKSSQEANYVTQLRKYGLDVSTTRILNASDQSQIWDETGMLFREWNEQKEEFEPEQLKIINNLIALTDDNWKSVKTVFGKVALSNGTYAYGVNAEVLLSKLILSEQLYVENEAGTFQIADNGLTATKGVNRIVINPNNDGEIFSIYKDSVKQVYIDNSGNAHFAGDISGSTGTFSGKVSGGSIDIGNGTFTVDAYGNLTAKKGTFTGTISSSTITGGSINIGNGSFRVDSSGNLTASKGVFSGTVSSSAITSSTFTGGSITIGNGTFSVDSSGNMIATNATVKNGTISGGTVIGTTIKASELYIYNSNTGGYSKALFWGYGTPDRPGLATGQVLKPYLGVSDGAIKFWSGGAVQTSDLYVTSELRTSYLYAANSEISYLNVYNLILNYGYGTSSGTTNTRVYRVNGEVGTYGVPSVGWVKAYASNAFSSIYHTHSNYASTSHTHSNYAYVSHTHSNYAAVNHEHYVLVRGGYNVRISTSYNFIPSSSSVYCGTSSNPFQGLYSVNGSVKTSDRRSKNSIEKLDEKYDLFTDKIMKRAKRYKYNRVENDSYRIGFIAQEVEEALYESGLEDGDFNGLIKEPIYSKKLKNGEYDKTSEIVDYTYGLIYEEFIALLYDKVAKLSDRVQQLEQRQ